MQRLASTIAGSLCLGYHATAAALLLHPSTAGPDVSLLVEFADASALFGAHLVVATLAGLGLLALHRGGRGDGPAGEVTLGAALLAGLAVMLPTAAAPLMLVGITILGLVAVLFDRLVHVPDGEDDEAAFAQALALIALASAKSARLPRSDDEGRG